MDLTNPMQSVIPSAQGSVLAVVGRTVHPMSGRAIAALTKPTVSQRRVNDILSELTAHGILLREKVGAAYTYRLNAEHLAAPAILMLANMRADFLARLRGLVTRWETPAEAAWLFGSAARGDAGPQSDVDVLVVRPRDADEEIWEAQTTSLADRVRAWTGNACEVLDLRPEELAAEVASGGRLVTDLRDHGIPLVEGDLRHLIKRVA